MKKTITSTLATLIFLIAVNIAFGQQPPWIYNKGQGNDQLYKKNYAEAVKSFTKCIKDNAQADECYSGRGKGYVALDKKVEASADFEKAVKLNPKNKEAVDGLAKLKKEPETQQNSKSLFGVDDYS